jgi:hypothetical protein
MTGDKITGAAVGGQITGGTMGALTGVAGAAGAADRKEAGTTRNAPPAGAVAVQDAAGNTLYTDGQTYYNSDGSINTAATESAGVVSGVGTDVAGPATGMTDKSAPGVSVGGSNLSLGTDSYGYRIPAGTKYENGLTYEGNGQWVFPNGSRMVVGSGAWDDASVKSFNPSKSYVTSFGTFGTSETAGAGTSAGGAGTGGGGGSGLGGGAGGGSSAGGVGAGASATAGELTAGETEARDFLAAQNVTRPEIDLELLAQEPALNISPADKNIIDLIQPGVASTPASTPATTPPGTTPTDRDILNFSGITQPGTSTVTPSTAVTQPTTVTPKTATPVQATSFTPATFIPAIAPRPEQPVRGPIIDNFPKTKPADQAVIDLIKPTPTPRQATVAGPATFTPAVVPGRGVETDEERIARIDAQTARVLAGEADYTTRSRPGTGTGNATGNVVISDGGLGGGGGNAAGNVIVGSGDDVGGGLGGNVTIDVGGGGGNATSNVSGNVVVDEPPVDEDEPPPPPPDEPPPPPPDEPEYKPEIFIYGGKEPPRRPRPELRTTLQGPFAPSTTLGQALTGYRGAGEIEGKKTGKPRKNVWNEESLRLKDALGL